MAGLDARHSGLTHCSRIPAPPLVFLVCLLFQKFPHYIELSALLVPIHYALYFIFTLLLIQDVYIL